MSRADDAQSARPRHGPGKRGRRMAFADGASAAIGSSAVQPGAARRPGCRTQRAAERVDAVGEPAQARAAGGVGASPAVVLDTRDQRARGRLDVDRARARPARTWRRWQAPRSRRSRARRPAPAGKRRGVDLEAERRAGLARELGQRGREPVLGQRPRVHALGEPGEVLDARRRARRRAVQRGTRLAVAPGGERAEPRVDTPASRAAGPARSCVAEPAALLVAGLDEPLPRGGDVAHAGRDVGLQPRRWRPPAAAADATDPASAGSRSAAGSCSSAATGTPPSSTRVTARSSPSATAPAGPPRPPSRPPQEPRQSAQNWFVAGRRGPSRDN